MPILICKPLAASAVQPGGPPEILSTVMYFGATMVNSISAISILPEPMPLSSSMVNSISDLSVSPEPADMIPSLDNAIADNALYQPTVPELDVTVTP